LNLPNPFEDSRVQIPSYYWLIHFSDLRKTLLKIVRHPVAAFQKSVVTNFGNVPTNKKKGITIQKRKVQVLLFPNILALSG
jgi:hypothetical protein